MGDELGIYQMALRAETDVRSSRLERARQVEQVQSGRSRTPMLLAWGLTLLAAVSARLRQHSQRESSGWRGAAVTGHPAEGSDPLA